MSSSVSFSISFIDYILEASKGLSFIVPTKSKGPSFGYCSSISHGKSKLGFMIYPVEVVCICIHMITDSNHSFLNENLDHNIYNPDHTYSDHTVTSYNQNLTTPPTNLLSTKSLTTCSTHPNLSFLGHNHEQTIFTHIHYNTRLSLDHT